MRKKTVRDVQRLRPRAKLKFGHRCPNRKIGLFG
jgi:hypothetical protein